MAPVEVMASVAPETTTPLRVTVQLDSAPGARVDGVQVSDFTVTPADVPVAVPDEPDAPSGSPIGVAAIPPEMPSAAEVIPVDRLTARLAITPFPIVVELSPEARHL